MMNNKDKDENNNNNNSIYDTNFEDLIYVIDKEIKKDIPKSINIDQPRWDQTTFIGRAKHFAAVTNPLNLFHSTSELNEAKDIVERHRAGLQQKRSITEDELWAAKHLYDSAFHPVTGEQTFLIGRMSAQVPMNMAITGGMMAFYKKTPAVVFWQWLNQSFNAVVNYCNRSDAAMTQSQIAMSYILATTGAVGTALLLKHWARCAPPLIGRLVPFGAVAAANCVNIPSMRLKELREGITVIDEKLGDVGKSNIAAFMATKSVIISRVVMAAPSMAMTPLVVNILDKRTQLFAKKPWMEPVVVIALCGVILIFATPLACALFEQRAPIKLKYLEKEIQEKVEPGVSNSERILYYNKGL